MGQPAARIGDMHTCPMVNPGPVPHVGGPVSGPCVPTVLIGGKPAAVVGDMCVCTGPPDTITKGSSGVFIGGRPAARMGDATAHGGVIVVGMPTVLIGEVAPSPPPVVIAVVTNTPGKKLKSIAEKVRVLRLAAEAKHGEAKAMDNQAASFMEASAAGLPFCKPCEMPSNEDKNKAMTPEERKAERRAAITGLKNKAQRKRMKEAAKSGVGLVNKAKQEFKLKMSVNSKPLVFGNKLIKALNNFSKTNEENKNLSDIENKLIKELINVGITDIRSQANILAQVKNESGFEPKSESAYYTSKRIREVFGNSKRVKNAGGIDNLVTEYEKLGGKESEEARKYLFDYVYGGGMGNDGEGYKYRGRGIVQLTGKNNYSKMTKFIGVDLVKDPNLVNDKKYTYKITAYYYKHWANGKDLTDSNQVSDVTGHTGGFKETKERKEDSKEYLKKLNLNNDNDLT